MISELWLLWASIVLGFVHIILQAHTMTRERGVEWNASARDEPKAPLTGIAGRLERALRNFLETFVFFAAAVLMAQAANIHNNFTVLGAWLYFLGRLAYLPLYAFGIPYVRSLGWCVATAGIFVILVSVLIVGLARAG